MSPSPIQDAAKSDDVRLKHDAELDLRSPSAPSLNDAKRPVDDILDDFIEPPKWSLRRRLLIVNFLGVATLTLSYNSSAYTTSIPDIQSNLGASLIQGYLGLSLYVVGFAVGPLLHGPLSEVFGRRIVYIVSYVIFAAFSIGVAFADSVTALLICRFGAGCAGVSSLNNAMASIGDVTLPRERGRYTIVRVSLVSRSELTKFRDLRPHKLRRPNAWSSDNCLHRHAHLLAYAAQNTSWPSWPRSTIHVAGGGNASTNSAKATYRDEAHAARIHQRGDQSRSASSSQPDSAGRDCLSKASQNAVQRTHPRRLLLLPSTHIWHHVRSLRRGSLRLCQNSSLRPRSAGLDLHFDFSRLHGGISGTLTPLESVCDLSVLQISYYPQHWLYMRDERALPPGGKLKPETRFTIGPIPSLSMPIGLFLFGFTRCVAGRSSQAFELTCSTSYPNLHW